MAKVPSKHSRDQDFEGLLNNLQDWELSFKEKDKKQRSDGIGKADMDHPVQKSGKNGDALFADSSRVNGKQKVQRTPSSDKSGHARHFDYLKDYDSLSRLSSGNLSEENAVDANSEKELGNEYFKHKKYNEAIDCYSRSIALSPTAVAYANRAMAFIKIRRFLEAEDDCTEALNLDDRYIKAYSRRSTARKELGKLKESVDDAEFALRLEPLNQEIKKQHAAAKSLFQKELLKKASGVLAGPMEGVQKPGKKVDCGKSIPKIQFLSGDSPVKRMVEIVEDHPEVRTTTYTKGNTRDVPEETLIEDGGDNGRIDESAAGNGLQTAKELGASLQELAAKASNLAKAEAAKNIVPPNSAYQFEVSWRGLSGDHDLQARLLKVTSPTALPAIFKSALSAPMLIDIIRCIATFFMEDVALGVEYLQNLTKVPRFDTIIMLLSSADKAELRKIWDEVFSKGTADYPESSGTLCSRYGIKQ